MNWDVTIKKARNNPFIVYKSNLCYNDACKVLDKLRGQVMSNKIWDCGMRKHHDN